MKPGGDVDELDQVPCAAICMHRLHSEASQSCPTSLPLPAALPACSTTLSALFWLGRDFPQSSSSSYRYVQLFQQSHPPLPSPRASISSPPTVLSTFTLLYNPPGLSSPLNLRCTGTLSTVNVTLFGPHIRPSERYRANSSSVPTVPRV